MHGIFLITNTTSVIDGTLVANTATTEPTEPTQPPPSGANTVDWTAYQAKFQTSRRFEEITWVEERDLLRAEAQICEYESDEEISDSVTRLRAGVPIDPTMPYSTIDDPVEVSHARRLGTFG